jgi:hypothetical protein
MLHKLTKRKDAHCHSIKLTLTQNESKIKIMKRLKNALFICGLVVFFNIGLHAQFKNIQGVSLHATEYAEDLESDDRFLENQIMTFSFKDKMFVHHLLDGEMVVQYYAITKVEYKEYDGFVSYTTTVKSGVSKKTYVYNIFIVNSTGVVIIEFDGLFYMGSAALVRTYKQ